METLELSPTQRNCPWYIALASGFVMAYLTFLVRQKFLPVADGSLFSSVDLLMLVFGTFIAIHFAGRESSTSLQISEPPLIIRTHSWYGRFKSTKHVPLTNVVWARVVYADEMLLSVEVGTYGHQTTTVVCMPYSEQNIPVAEQLCAKIASALRLENKGCHRHV